MSDDFFLNKDTLPDMIDAVLSEYSKDNEDYLPANQVYNDLAWFYYAGIQDAGRFESSDDVVNTYYDNSENWTVEKLADLGDLFETYFLTGYHGGSKLGDY